MRVASRFLSCAGAALALISAVPAAEARPGGGWHGRPHVHGHAHGRHWGAAPFWGGVGIGIGLGSLSGGYYGSYHARPWGPDYVVVEPPAVVYRDAPPAEPLMPSAPDPVIYPRNGQGAAQTEADRRDCNRWATTQPSAMNDASVFQRATLACMDGRGYSVR